MSAAIRTVLLKSGFRMPIIGLGTWMMLECQETAVAIDQALHLGYRHIDTAVSYQNEQVVGDVVNQRIKAGQLKREDVFITTKIPPVMLERHHVRPCVEESLCKLKTPYVDMLLIHSPFGNKNQGNGDLRPVNAKGERELAHHDICETWCEMENLVRDDKWARSLGLSNFNISQIERISKTALVPPSNVQLECHIYNQQTKIVAYCHARNIAVTGYSCLGNPQRTKVEGLTEAPNLFDNPIIQKASLKYRKTPAQILLRFLIQRDIIAIPKSVHVERLKENMNIFDFNIEQSLWERIEDLDQGYRFLTFDWAKSHPEYDNKESF